jgi:hypothetical protein
MPIKLGALVSFETAKYVAHGAVISMAAVPAGGAAR